MEKNTSPGKINEWLISTGKDAQHHESLGKCSLTARGASIAHPPLGPHPEHTSCRAAGMFRASRNARDSRCWWEPTATVQFLKWLNIQLPNDPEKFNS